MVSHIIGRHEHATCARDARETGDARGGARGPDPPGGHDAGHTRDAPHVRHARTVVDVLTRRLGVTSYDDLGSPYKLTLQSRGFAAGPVVGLGQGLSVFLDGVPVNEPDAAQVNFDLLPLERVTRIEVLSGTAALLGPNTLGGAVNLVTQDDTPGDAAAHGDV